MRMREKIGNNDTDHVYSKGDLVLVLSPLLQHSNGKICSKHCIQRHLNLIERPEEGDTKRPAEQNGAGHSPTEFRCNNGERCSALLPVAGFITEILYVDRGGNQSHTDIGNNPFRAPATYVHVSWLVTRHTTKREISRASTRNFCGSYVPRNKTNCIQEVLGVPSGVEAKFIVHNECNGERQAGIHNVVCEG